MSFAKGTVLAAPGKERSWKAFVDWCEERGLRSAPAHIWTLAAYIRYLEGSMRYDTLCRHIDRIGQMHFEKIRKRPDRDPEIQKVLEGVRRRIDEKKKPPPPPPLFRDEDFLEDRPKSARRVTKPKKEPAPRRGLRATPKLVSRRRV